MFRPTESLTCLAILASACSSSAGEPANGAPPESLSRPLSNIEATASLDAEAHPALLVKQEDPAGYDAAAVLTEMRSICGASDLQSVSTYDGSLGVSTGYVAAHKRAVGALSRSNIPGANTKYCSGTLVGRDLFLTASHCVDTHSLTSYVAFNYEQGQAERFFPILEVVEDHPSLDIALLRLGGNPAVEFGAASMRFDDVSRGEPIAIIQHPSGRPKEIEAGQVASNTGFRLSYEDLDTEPGSSGAGILDAQGRLVGVHTSGGCGPTGGANRGTPITRALGSSAAIDDFITSPPGIVWRRADGQVHVWFMSGSTIVSEALPGGQDPSQAWQIQGTGDFDGNRELDILWRHTSGQVAIWYMHRGTVIGEGYPGATNPGWTIQGVGNFDGDYYSDILWRETTGQLSIWFDGSNVKPGFPSYQNAGGPVPLEWQVQGIGDFRSDGHSDIVWRHTNGQVAIWNMYDGAFVDDVYPGGPDPSQSWTIQGIGDFDRDFRSDILWRQTTGRLAIWFEGSDEAPWFPSYQEKGGLVHEMHQIEGIADYNLDGHSDILWRSSDGYPAIWAMKDGKFFVDLYPDWVDPSTRLEAAFDALPPIW